MTNRRTPAAIRPSASRTRRRIGRTIALLAWLLAPAALYAQGEGAPPPPLVTNGSFDNGTAGWLQFATPNPGYMVSRVLNGVFEFYRNAPPPGTTNQAVVFQQTGVSRPSGSAVAATFDLGNTDDVRKRVSVLLHDADFSDLHVCTFWLPPHAPSSTYGMRTHTTRPWSNLTISFYAASPGNTGFYQLDNVSVLDDVASAADRTTCEDPTAPAPTNGTDSANLLVNGGFGTGLSPGWTVFGQIGGAVTSGVFQFVKLAGTPAGVILQPTLQAVSAGDQLTATLQLGNSSLVRKRVTVIVHDNNFSDLAACTFWLAPNQPLSAYRVKSFASKDWTNATLSVYPATAGDDQWIRMDDATLRRTPATTTLGTECLEPHFNYSRELLGTSTLSLVVQSSNPATLQVTINGGDTRGPTTPFTFDWGDGSVTSGFFPQSHTFTSGARNYLCRVTAHYAGGQSDFADVAIRFVPAPITRLPVSPALAVTIPPQAVTLGSRQAGYIPPAGLVPFDDSYFSPTLPRADVEYVLSQAAAIESAILEGDMESVNGGFNQVVLREPTFGGAYSLWFTTPVAFAANGNFFQGTPGYSSLFHEMGHNFSLNAPAAFRYGGRIDGSANAIFSEAIAQMFQHAVAYELVNNAVRYGLPADLAYSIGESARASARSVRSNFDTYVAQGLPFSSWNDPVTPLDETVGTFMTLTRMFMVHAEQSQSYVPALTRTMRLLRTFNQSLQTQYAPQTNSVQAATFRATLMVAALSYGFDTDLRSEFRALAFPIDDATYTTLRNSIP